MHRSRGTEGASRITLASSDVIRLRHMERPRQRLTDQILFKFCLQPTRRKNQNQKTNLKEI